MFDINRVELDWGGRKLILETGKIARQADGAVIATYGETTVLATVVAAKQPKPGIDFLPLTVNYQEKYLRRRPHPRRLFQARRPSDRKGDAGLAPDRPPDPSALRRRLALRHAGDRHHALARPGERSRHRRDGRGLRRAHALRRALHGPDRRRARRLHQRRICAQPADRRDGREPARSRRRRHAGRGADGGIGSQGAVRRHHARRGDVRPPAFPAGDRGDHRARREGREGAARFRGRRTCPRSRRKCSASSRRTCARPIRSRARRNARTPSPPPRRRRWRISSRTAPTIRNARRRRSPACSRSSKARSSAGTSSTPASASTAAIS